VEDEGNIYFGALDEDLGGSKIDINKMNFSNIKSNYEEKLYTTELDHKVIPESYKNKAEKIVKEILESDTTENVHIKEERGLIAQTECGDEEEKYSSVIRQADESSNIK
jgi:PAB1-binding protein PBP1